MSNRKLKFVDGNMVEYEILPLVDKYDPVLREVMPAIDFETMPGKDISYVSMSLMETLNHYRGAGLSANQVGLRHRMCAIAVENKIWNLINPIIIDKSDKLVKANEGCLSFPGLFLTINRPSWVEVEFFAANGTSMKQRFDGLPAIVVQHEMNHLDGILFTDLVSELKLERAKSKVKSNIRKIKRILAASGALSN